MISTVNAVLQKDTLLHVISNYISTIKSVELSVPTIADTRAINNLLLTFVLWAYVTNFPLDLWHKQGFEPTNNILLL